MKRLIVKSLIKIVGFSSFWVSMVLLCAFAKTVFAQGVVNLDILNVPSDIIKQGTDIEIEFNIIDPNGEFSNNDEIILKRNDTGEIIAQKKRGNNLSGTVSLNTQSDKALGELLVVYVHDNNEIAQLPEEGTVLIVSDPAILSLAERVTALEKTDPVPGADGISCWDLNGNGVGDIPAEDTNNDSVVNVADCQGPAGAQGEQGIQGLQGEPGQQGEQGLQGQAGADGISCWDLNGNGVGDIPAEDTNNDLVVNVADCQGPQGPQGEQGEQGLKGDNGAPGANGISCWDLNGNGVGDIPAEDTNNDLVVDAADCQGPAGGAAVHQYVIVVCTVPGEGDFTDPVAAIDAIGTTILPAASASFPYLIDIKPGVYNIRSNSVQMKPYVDIQGSGENITRITGNIDSTSLGVVKGASNAELRLLTVENTGGGRDVIAIHSVSKITHVTAIASGGIDNNIAVINYGTSFPILTNVTAIASGGATVDNIGVSNVNSSPTMTQVTAIASGGPGGNVAVRNYGPYSPTMTNVTATASGGGLNSGSVGVYNLYLSSPIMNNVTITASGGSASHGVVNTNSSPTMTNVTISASGGTSIRCVDNNISGAAWINNSLISCPSGYSIYNPTQDITYISNTKLVGTVLSGYGPVKCVGAYDGSYNALDATCH